MIGSPVPTIPARDVTALILAGGAGRRMGGADKGLIEIEGKPLVLHVAQALMTQVGEVIVSANRNAATYQSLGFAVVRDELSGYCGPLAGLISGLPQIKTPYMVVLPCDAPRVPPDFVARMLGALLTSKAEVAVAHDGERWQPVHLLLKREVLPNLRHYVGKGNRKVQHWVRTCHHIEVDFSDQVACFNNINTPQDYPRVD